MAYAIVEKQPPLRDPELDWSDFGPGLYDDGEVLVKTGTLYATVSFVTEWLENGGGVNIKGTARWCKADGQTELTDAGQHVETFSSITVSPAQIEEFGVEAFAKEALLALLGEPPALVREVPTPPDGNMLVPVVQLSDEVRLNMSIVHAAKTVKATRTVPAPIALLA